MTELLSTLAGLITSLGNVQSAAALREHVALLRERYELLREQCESLEKELSDSTERCRVMHEELERYRAAEQYVERSGALFRRTADGYDEVPVCPKCHTAMHAWAVFPYQCGNPGCRINAAFGAADLRAVMAKLPTA